LFCQPTTQLQWELEGAVLEALAMAQQETTLSLALSLPAVVGVVLVEALEAQTWEAMEVLVEALLTAQLSELELQTKVSTVVLAQALAVAVAVALVQLERPAQTEMMAAVMVEQVWLHL
jgi:hypothetical protein